MVDSASSRGKEADHSSLKVVLLRVYKDPMAFIAIKAYSCRDHLSTTAFIVNYSPNPRLS